MAFTTYDNAPYLYRRSGGGGDKEIAIMSGGQTVATFDFYVEVLKSA